MSGRLLLIPVLLLGLIVLLGPGRRSDTRRQDTTPAAPDPTAPIVAVRGEPLAEFEEPLPPGARVRIGSTRFRHPTDLSDEAAVVVGQHLVTTSDQGLMLTDLRTGRRRPVPVAGVGRGDGWWLYCPDCLTASPDGKRFLFLHCGRGEAGRATGRVWEIGPDPGQPVTPVACIHLPPGTADWVIERARFSADGLEVQMAGWEGVLSYSLTTGGVTRTVRSDTHVLDLAAAGNRFVSASEDEPLILCGGGFGSVPTYRFRPPGPPDSPANLARAFRAWPERRPDQPVDLIVRDSRTGTTVATIAVPTPRPCYPRQVALSRDGRYVAANCDRTVFVWEVDSGAVVLRVEPEDRAGRRWPDYLVPRFPPGGQTVAVGAWDWPERRFDLRTGRPVPEGPRGPAEAGVGPHGIARPPAGPGRPAPLPPGYAGVIIGVSPDGRLIATGDLTGRLDVWWTDGRPARTLRTDGAGLSALTFSPDGRRLAACDRGGLLQVWSADTWRERHRLEVPVEDPDLWPDRLTFTADGRRILLSRGDMMALWEPGAPDWLWDRAGTWSSAGWDPPPVFSPDGRYLMTAGRGQHRSTWLDPATGAEAREFDHAGPIDGQSSVSALAVSPDGRAVATLHGEGAIRIHNVNRGTLIRAFPESHAIKARARVLRYSPDGRRLATCDDSGRAHIWEVATGQLAFTLTYPDGAIQDVHFGRDGRSLITANHREVIVWDLPAEPGSSADPWDDLAHEAPRAERARRALLADPTGTVALLRERLRPAEPLDEANIRRLVRSLDSDDYRDRHRAAAGLFAAGRRVLPWLKEAKPASGEGNARLAAVVRDLSAGLTPAERREVRAVEVLEQIGTPAARALIGRLAAGHPGAVLTEEAGKGSRASNGVVGSGPERQGGHPLSGPTWTTATTARPLATGSRAPPTGGLRSVTGARTTD